MKAGAWIREHPWTAAPAALLAACLLAEGALLWVWSGAAADLHRERRPLGEMRRLADECQKARSGAADAAVLPRAGDFSPLTVDRIIKEKGLADRLGSSSASRRRVDERTEEQTITLTLNGVMREDLVKFLRAVEAAAPGVRTSALRVSLNAKTTALVDAKVEISAYEASAPASK